MAEGARLESVYTATYRGFESPPHRHIQERARTKVRAFCLYVSPKPRGDENTRPGFDNWRSQLDRRRACEETARRASAASQSPLTAIFKEELVRKYGLFFHIKPPPLPDGCARAYIRHKKNRALRPGLYDSETKINARLPACAFAHSENRTSMHFSLYPARQ